MVLRRRQHIKLGRLEVDPVGSRNAFTPLSLVAPGMENLAVGVDLLTGVLERGVPGYPRQRLPRRAGWQPSTSSNRVGRRAEWIPTIGDVAGPRSRSATVRSG